MTTPRDLLIVALDEESSRPLERGDLSLALAGAELTDLLTAQAVSLDGTHLVPGYRPTIADRLLDEAAGSLVDRTPYETVDDWLWRRGRDLSTAYLAAFEEEGQLTRQRRRGRRPFRGSEMVLADTPARRAATDRWVAEEPVLVTLAASLGIGDERTDSPPDVPEGAVATVLGAVDDALRQLEFERQRRALDKAAFDNVWRGPGGD
ncbi:GOLPH3/VPS74 family protein [Streptomyces lydicus]|uniref:GOLPH3/VPS74 family protein n=1 Tax=Streptomyces lydicus TaxID=47763 RepID=UPI003321F2C3